MTNAESLGSFHGPLRVCSANPRYFADDRGQAIYLTGSHTWANLVEVRLEGEPDFPYNEYLDFMQEHHHNFMRLWAWGHSKGGPWTEDIVCFEPMPHARTGPGRALDGKPKFDLGCWNQAYFDRLRSRVIQAGERGIYVSVMLFEGWCVRWSYPGSDAWPYHPYNIQNNVNGVNGDPDGDGKGDVYTLEAPDALEYQKAYIRQIIDTVNDLDNVLYEIINEMLDDERGLKWHYHMIDYVHEYEKSKPKQHPVGMTTQGGSEHIAVLLASGADWISPARGENSEYCYNPPAADGSKVVLSDTDHLWGGGGNYRWAWKSFLRGLNPLFMDFFQPLPGRLPPTYPGYGLNDRDYPDWEPLRRSLGDARRFAERLDLNRTLPHGELASSGYCLAHPGRAYLAYVPDDPAVHLDLSASQGTLFVEWFNPRTGETVPGDPVPGGYRHRLVSPFGSDAVVFVQAGRCLAREERCDSER